MATDQARKPRELHLTAEECARVEAVRAKRRTPEARAEEARVREALEREYRETGTLKSDGDGTTMGDLVAFRRFVMSLRRERERAGLSLTDVAERAKIDKAALSRLENGQQLNPTINTLARYARAIGKSLTYVLAEKAEDMPRGRAIRYCSPEALYTSDPYEIGSLGKTRIFIFPDAPIYSDESEEAPLSVQRTINGFVVEPPSTLETIKAIRPHRHTSQPLPVTNFNKWSRRHPQIPWGDS
jgi:transcriptional regulator with XRE-family HTH domain